jgi:hypothetical protein
MDDVDCATKHCDQPATLGMTLLYGGLRIEIDLCQPHFDVLAATDPPGNLMRTDERDELNWWRRFATHFGPGDLPTPNRPLLGYRLAVFIHQGGDVWERWNLP